MPAYALDDDAVVACADLAGRSGATKFEVGYLHDNVPACEAGWYAHAMYKGARISIDDQRGPVEACDALARRLLEGARCAHCHALVTLSDAGAVARDAAMADGTRWTAREQAKAGLCRWRRMGPRWARGCESGPADKAAGR